MNARIFVILAISMFLLVIPASANAGNVSAKLCLTGNSSGYLIDWCGGHTVTSANVTTESSLNSFGDAAYNLTAMGYVSVNQTDFAALHNGTTKYTLIFRTSGYRTAIRYLLSSNYGTSTGKGMTVSLSTTGSLTTVIGNGSGSYPLNFIAVAGLPNTTALNTIMYSFDGDWIKVYSGGSLISSVRWNSTYASSALSSSNLSFGRWGNNYGNIYGDDITVILGVALDGTNLQDTEYIANPKAAFTSSSSEATAPLTATLTGQNTGNIATTSITYFGKNVTGNNTEIVLSSGSRNATVLFPVGNWSVWQQASNTYGVSNSTQAFVNVTPNPYTNIQNLSNLTYPRSIRWLWNSSGYNTAYIYWNGELHKTVNSSVWSDYWTDLEPLTNYTLSVYTDVNSTWVNKTVQTGYGPTDQWVEIDFDDNHEGIYDNAWPIMSAAGINHANMLVISNRIVATNHSGVPGPYEHYMSLANLSFLCNDQHWNCTNHQDRHGVSNFLLSETELYYDFVNGSRNLTYYGLTGSEYKMSYRGGGNNASIRAIARAAGQQTGRGVVISPHRQLPNYTDLWNMTVTDTVIDTHTAAYVLGKIDAGLTGHNQTATITFHEVSDTYILADGTTVSIANFTAIMNGIRDRGLKVITVNEWYALDQASPPVPVANFTTNTSLSTIVNTPVLFLDNSTNETIAWNWSFGDGSYQYIPMNLTKIYALNTTPPAVEHTYTATGEYTVVLNASNGFGYSVVSKNITISDLPPVASFTTNATGNNALHDIMFTDTSSNYPTVWDWDYGDGTTHGTANITSHYYGSTGSYIVNLTVSNAWGSSYTNKTITVYDTPLANWTSTVITGVYPMQMQFTSSSANYTSLLWSFGDGNTSALQNPVHQYDVCGYMTVSLNASNPAAFNILSRPDYVYNACNSTLPYITPSTTSSIYYWRRVS